MSRIYGNHSYSTFMAKGLGLSQTSMFRRNAVLGQQSFALGRSFSAASTNKAGAVNVRFALESFMAAANSLANLGKNTKYTAYSSDPGISVSQSSVSSKLHEVFKDTTVKVEQIATKQKNMGDAIASDKAGYEAGSYSFSIDQMTPDGRVSKEYTIEITDSDDAESIQQKMADAINNDSDVVNASVISDADTGESRLVLEAKETGSLNNFESFQVRDIASPGEKGLVAQMGVGSSGSEGSVRGYNAIYSVNGEMAQMSSSNTVDIGYGMMVTFEEATKATISLKPDKEKVHDAAGNFAEAYNNLISALMESGSYGALASLQSLMNSNSNSLSDIGFDLAKDGSLQINGSKLNAAADSGKLQSFFENDGVFSFSNKLRETAQSFINNPAMLLSGGSSVNATYNNLGKLNAMSSLLGSMFGDPKDSFWF